MVLNSTNGQLIARLLGSKNSDDWIGKEIDLYNDPNVTFAGELVGGIRARKAQRKATATMPQPENGEISIS
jgi:hypothetical protein